MSRMLIVRSFISVICCRSHKILRHGRPNLFQDLKSHMWCIDLATELGSCGITFLVFKLLCSIQIITVENMASQLENAMETLIKVFHTYSSKEGDKYKLSKAELRSLLQGELSVFLAVSLFSNDLFWFAGSRLLS